MSAARTSIIFLLSAVGAYLLFLRPTGVIETLSAIIYAIGLGLTFDEFGMWLHLGGPYWQRASFDAVVVIASFLGLIAYAPNLAAVKPKHWVAAAAIAVLLAFVVHLSAHRLQTTEQRAKDRIQQIEAESPP